MDLKGVLLSNYNFLLFFINIIKLNKSNWQLAIKFFNNKLNIKLYNKLSKEIKDFKD